MAIQMTNIDAGNPNLVTIDTVISMLLDESAYFQL
jgi:hypothetical protein